MISVLHLIDSLRGGGKERQLIEFLKASESCDEIVNEVVLFKNMNQYEESKNLSVRFHILKRRIKKDPTVFLKLRKIINTYKPDIILSWGTMPSVYALPFVMNKKVKFVNYMIQNGICKVFSKNWIRSKLTFPFSDIVMANSFAGIEKYPTPVFRSCVIYNGVHLDRFEVETIPSEIRQKFGIKTKFVVGMVGAFHPRKDYHTFISTALSICSKRDDITFIAIGDGQNLEKEKSRVPQEYRELIQFTGRQSQVEEIINIFDIGILMSNPLIHREGISNSIIEYMAMEKPVIASSGGGTPEIIDNHYSGFIIRPSNPQELESKITFLLANEELRQLFGKRGKEKVLHAFTIDIMFKAFLDLFKELNAQDE
ncbi:MAG: glycosyltransferase [Bacteroidales bacterium]|nr:glycosyltransferase [Bacteroidales bacterium]